MQEERARERRADPGEAPGAGHRLARRSRAAARPPPRPPGSSSSAASSAAAAPGRSSESSLSSRQKRPLASREQGRVVGRLARPPLELDQADVPPQRPHRLRRAVARGVVEDEDLALDAGRMGALDRLQAGEQVLAAVRVHDAVGERGRHGRTIIARMADSAAGRDPRAARRPLGVHAALRPCPGRGARPRRRRGRAADQPLPLRAGAGGRGLPGGGALLPAQRRARARGAAAAAPSSSPSTCRTCCASAAIRAPADVVHYQWLTLPGLDARLLPPGRPRVMTAHYVLPPRPSRRQVASARRAFGGMDAVVAHSEHGARRLREEVGLDPARVRVIPHGAFDYLTRLPDEAPLPPELEGAEGPVVLFFGLLRPYKGIDTLLRAFRRVDGRRALGRRQPAHGARAAAATRRARRRAGSASSPASSRTPRSRRSSAAPTSSPCPTATPSTPASSTPASPSASRWC